MKPFLSKYGPWALVAGASEGIGAEFAAQLAKRGFHLVLVARRQAPLDNLAQKLQAEFSIQVRTLSADLGNLGDSSDGLGLDRLTEDIGLVIYNAAASPIGPFLDQSMAAHRQVLEVNCQAPAWMCHTWGLRLKKRGRGGIILMSSLAGMQGTACVAHYAASKAYNLVLAEGLWFEFKSNNVDVLACVAGATSTPNFIATQPAAAGLLAPKPSTPAQVVEAALKNLGKRPMCIPGWSNRLAAFFMRRLLPRTLAVKLISRATQKMYASKP